MARADSQASGLNRGRITVQAQLASAGQHAGKANAGQRAGRAGHGAEQQRLGQHRLRQLPPGGATRPQQRGLLLAQAGQQPAASTSPAAGDQQQFQRADREQRLASTMVLAMQARVCGRLEVTFSPEGAPRPARDAWLVLAASASMFPRAMGGACGNTSHEAWLAVSAPPNAAGFTTAGP